MEDNEGLATADTLISAFVLGMARARLQRLPSTLAFIDDFYDPGQRMGRLFCNFVSVMCAYTYLEQFQPHSRIERCSLFSSDVPSALAERICSEEYNKLLQPLRDLVRDTKYSAVRAKGAGIGAAIGTAVAAPFALAVGILTIGLGAPVSLGVLAAGSAIGSSAGAALPLVGNKVFRSMMEQVEVINTITEPRNFVLLDPKVTNRINATSDIKKVADIEWVVRTLPQDEPDTGTTSTTSTTETK